MDSPIGIDDGGLVLSDMVIVPVPGLGIDRFTDGTQDTNGRQVVVVDMVNAKTTEETDGSRSRVKVSETMFFDGLPVTGRGGVYGSGLEEGGCDTISERTVDDIGMAGDPANISHAGEAVIGMDIKDIFEGDGSTEEVACGRVHETLWFSC